MEELREELLNRSENITNKLGNLTIRAAIQETYRNGEIHFRDVSITHETEKRTLTITGLTAQTKPSGNNVSFVEMERNIEVESSDGLNLKSKSLNYESDQERIFSNDRSTFSINNLSGKANRFVYYTETRLLELIGNVQCRYFLEENENNGEVAGEGETAKDGKPVRISANRLVYDQEAHTVQLIGKARVAQGGSYIIGQRIDAELTDDNRKFISMTVLNSEVKEKPDTGKSVEIEEPEEQQSTANISHHASGIKTMKAKTLDLEFHQGDTNQLKKITARGNANLEITPTAGNLRKDDAELKKISGDSIQAMLGEDGKGLRNLLISQKNNKARVEIRPLNSRKKSKKKRNKDKTPPKIMTARDIDAKIDPETNNFTHVTMTDNVKMTQGETEITCQNARYETETEQVRASGSPVLKDGAKRVTGNSMVISLAIGDLTAEGTVESLFYPPKKKKGNDPGIFVIGKDISETTVNAGSLSFDYSNNILRYQDDVRIGQGSTIIQSQRLDIDQANSRLTALGEVKATLAFNKEEDEANGQQTSNGTDETEEDDSSIFLTGSYLTVDKKNREVRIKTNAQSILKGMTIIAQDIAYELTDDDTLLKSVAKKEVRVEIGKVQIFGDTAEFFMKEKILMVKGKNVRYFEEGKMEANFNSLVYDMTKETMYFDARADKMIETKIIK